VIPAIPSFAGFVKSINTKSPSSSFSYRVIRT
jgi:hypothetical protein